MKNVPSFLSEISVAVVTGGSSGIGEAFLKAIANYSQEIAIFNLSRSKPKINFANLRHIPCDLSDLARLEAAAAQVLAELSACKKGKLLLVNNSGYGVYGFADAMDSEALLGMVDLNARAPVALTHRLLPALKARGGTVVNIASVAAYLPTPTIAVYGATKAFVLSWGMSLRAELRDCGVNVLTVCPGPTSTNFFKRAGFDEAPLPVGLGTTADFVARKALAAAARGRAVVTPGFTNKVQRFLSAILPREWAVPISFWVLKRVRLDALNHK